MKIKVLFVWLLFGVSAVWSQGKMSVYFDFDQFMLNEEASQKLTEWAASADQFEVTKVYGFCDWKGTNIYNDSLSVKRVNSVVTFLKDKNIKVKPGYEIRAFGEDFTQSKLQSENRRVTIIYDVRKDDPPAVVKNPDGSLPWQEQIKTSKAGDLITINNINFYNMTPRMMPKSRTILYDLLCIMEDHPKLKIEIQGHICCQSTNDLQGLSVARAKVIYNFLIMNKIDRKRLSYKGFGTTKPIYPIPEKNEMEEEANRRVEIMIVENEP